jgi:hypothetical protein
MGPTTPSRFALNEASWSGTPCSAGYEWSSEPQARAKTQLTRAYPKRAIDECTCEFASYESSLEPGPKLMKHMPAGG